MGDYLNKWRLLNRGKMNESAVRYYHKNRERISIERKTRKLVSKGKIKKTLCAECSDKNVVQYHMEYNDPRNVIWYCAECRKVVYEKEYATITEVEKRMNNDKYYRWWV